VKLYLEGKPLKKMIPWYKKFKGGVSEIEEGQEKYLVNGVFKRISNTVLQITELPVGVWTDDYKIFLEKLIQTNGLQGLSDFVNKSTDEDICFDLVFDKTCLDRLINSGEDKILKTLKLNKTVTFTNVHLFNSKGVITKYDSPEAIVREFCETRLLFNSKRKDYLLKTWQDDWDLLSSKYRFVTDIIAEKISVFRKKRDEIKQQLISRNYIEIKGSYDYLVTMPIHSFSQETLKDLETKITNIETKVKDLESKTSKDIAMEDLGSLEKHLKD
jgi:DNA topoisomerase-2